MKTFETWLQDLHAKYYNGLDDEMPEHFDEWLKDKGGMMRKEIGNALIRLPITEEQFHLTTNVICLLLIDRLEKVDNKYDRIQLIKELRDER